MKTENDFYMSIFLLRYHYNGCLFYGGGIPDFFIILFFGNFLRIFVVRPLNTLFDRKFIFRKENRATPDENRK